MYPDPPSRTRRRWIPFALAAALAVALIVGVRVVVLGGDGGHSCGSGGVTLIVQSSPEKAGQLREIAHDYGGRKVGGRCAQVTVRTKSSGNVMEALARGWDESRDGGPRPDVWTPASSSWVTLLRRRVENTDRAGIVPASTPSIIQSPLVIAMPRPMAQALGWPGKEIGWSDVLDLARDPKGWARAGHPEWGEFRLGKTNPNFSTSGLNATIGTYFAATHRASDLSEQDIDDPKVQDFVRGVERSIVHYGDTTLTFLSNLQRADDEGQGLSYISAVTVEEQSLYQYNLGNPTGDPKNAGRHARPRTPLVAIYPKEGTLVSDHPYVTFGWASPDKQRVAADFLRYLHGDAAQKRFQAAGFRDHQGRPGPQLTRANGLLPDRPAQRLSVPAPAVLDKLLQSWARLRKPANVLIVMDTSGSMAEDVPGTGKTKIELARQAAADSLGQFGGGDRVGLWMFSTRLVKPNQDWRELVPIGPMNASVDGTPRPAALRQRIGGMIAGGGTGLYDTVLGAYETIAKNPRPDAINAIVVMTDGRNEDDNSIGLEALTGRLHTEATANTVRVFTISYGKDADHKVLQKIAQATNAAEYDSSDPSSIDQVFTQVISNF